MLEAHKRDARKFLPEITVDSIAPPYPHYPCFEGLELYPFRPHAPAFDMVNAWWLIEATILAWEEPDAVTEKFRHAGLSEVSYFSGKSTQGYVADNEDFLIVVFRGTEIRLRPGKIDFGNIIVDVMADADFLLVDSGQGGKVHKGFKAALDEVWEAEGLLDYLKSKDNGSRTFWFTGHSLGAPLAALAAQRFGNVQGLYTFGSPRIGDLDFKSGFKVKTYRFVNHNDLVTRVPPAGIYQHVGDVKHIDGQGRIQEYPDTAEGVVNGIGAEISSGLSALAGRFAGNEALIPEAIVDHVPIFYSTYIWNNIP
jgi:triacylglycerol lipase